MKFRVVLPRFKWRACLQDLADCLVDGLTRGGHSVELSDEFRQGTEIEVAFGAHDPTVTLPAYPVVIYQTEVPASGWFTTDYKARLRGALAVWEAAPGFVTQEAERTSVVAPGSMTLLPSGAAKDIDILFYGSLSPRRVALLTKLQDAGLAPSVHFGVFGKTRDNLIDRAKLVVDIKQGEGDPNDNTRLFFLDSRCACVLSENDDDPKRALAPWRIVEQCRELLEDDVKRVTHMAARRAELKPMDTRPAVAQLTAILRKHNQFKVVAGE